MFMKTEKYRFLRDRVANGFVKNPTKLPSGQIAPDKINISKWFKKGDVVDGVVYNNTLTIDVIDAKDSSGKVYNDGVHNLVTNISDTRDGVTTYWMEKVDEKQNSNSLKINRDSLFTTKNIVIGVASIGVLFGILKFTKLI